jgi:hypothetical protein
MDNYKELEAQRKRVQALKYLQTQGQHISNSTVVIQNIGKNFQQKDNTLELLLKQSTSITEMKRIEQQTKNSLIQQQKLLSHEKKNEKELPLDWNPVVDRVTNKTYYWNRKTNLTVWEKPVIAGLSSTTTSIEPAGTPDEWTKCVHNATKQTYWHNKITGENCFDKILPQPIKKIAHSDTVISSSEDNQNKLSSMVKKRKIDIDPLDITEGKVSN